MPTDYHKWLFKYKLLHLIMWIVVTSSTFFVYYDSASALLPQVCNALAVSLVSTIPFYTTAYFFIPKFLYRKQYVMFILYMLVQVTVSGILTMIFVRTVDHVFDSKRPIIPADSTTLRFALNLFIWNALIASFGAGGLKIMSDRFKIEKRLRIVEKEKISTELNFLRSQINPHFLFNLINTIYFQIDKKNVAARSSVEKLSEMLRYQLYECTSDKIELTKELEYIKNYVTVQTLRMEAGSDVQLHICSTIQECKIAPLLLLPIVENAFKHVSHFKEVALNKIHIQLKREGKQFVAEVYNTYDKTSAVKHLVNSGGLGVQNLKRRLELLYPGAHQLQIIQTNNDFNTRLKVNCYD